MEWNFIVSFFSFFHFQGFNLELTSHAAPANTMWSSSKGPTRLLSRWKWIVVVLVVALNLKVSFKWNLSEHRKNTQPNWSTFHLMRSKRVRGKNLSQIASFSLNFFFEWDRSRIRWRRDVNFLGETQMFLSTNCRLVCRVSHRHGGWDTFNKI